MKKQLHFSILDLAKILEILNKEAAMKHFKPSLLSLQKEIAQRNICLESEIDRSMDSFGFRTMLHQCGIHKQKGY
ncbi:MAG: hypothetical protein U9N58_03345, partial [Thermodesulfobacteriota bacterium]|nr:hypothetical protein [Thermodesulfobacteriota bacterium]